MGPNYLFIYFFFLHRNKRLVYRDGKTSTKHQYFRSMSSDGNTSRSSTPGSIVNFIVDDDYVEYEDGFVPIHDEENDYGSPSNKRRRVSNDISEDSYGSEACSEEEDESSEEQQPAFGGSETDEDYVDKHPLPRSGNLPLRRSARARKVPERYIDVKNYQKYMLADDAEGLFSTDEDDDAFSIRTEDTTNDNTTHTSRSGDESSPNCQGNG